MSLEIARAYATHVPRIPSIHWIARLWSWFLGCQLHTVEGWIFYDGRWHNVAKIFIVKEVDLGLFYQTEFLQALLSLPLTEPHHANAYYVDGVYYKTLVDFKPEYKALVEYEDTTLPQPTKAYVYTSLPDEQPPKKTEAKTLFFGISFDIWNSSSGRFFVADRIYWRSKFNPSKFSWTPFVKFRKRYSTWFGNYLPR